MIYGFCYRPIAAHRTLYLFHLHKISHQRRQENRMFTTLLLVFGIQIQIIWTGHYKAGTTTWKPTKPNATGSRIEILISQKHSFTENQMATIQIPAADCDIEQRLACRFASDTYGYGTECLDICGNLPKATISAT